MIKILFVDDSALIRSMLKQVFREDSRFAIGGDAENGAVAVEKAKTGAYDLIIMDINMPVMDGIEATRRISSFSNAAIIMFTTEDSIEGTYKCLSAGAVEIIKKPNLADMSGAFLNEFREKIYLIAKSRQNNYSPRLPVAQAETKSDIPQATVMPEIHAKDYKILFIGSSTGGPSALQTLLHDLPGTFPLPIMITQHIDDLFDVQLVKWLNDTTNFQVTLAKSGEEPHQGHVYIAPAKTHMQISLGADGCYRIVLNDDSPLHFLKPSVDKLFLSAAKSLKSKTLAVILTGMGKDGADGAAEIKKAGGFIIAQDEKTSVVFGMPKAVIEEGAASLVLPLDMIADAIEKSV